MGGVLFILCPCYYTNTLNSPIESELKKISEALYMLGLWAVWGYVYMCVLFCAMLKRRGIKYPRKIRLVKMGRKYGGIIWGYHRGLYFKPLFYTPSKSGVLSYRSIAYPALCPGRKKASFGLSASPSQWLPISCNQ